VRLQEHLGVTAGQIGGGRAKMRGTVDVAMLQTLARRDDVAALTAGYGSWLSAPAPGTLAAAAAGGSPERSLTVHLTAFVYRGDADPSAPGGIAAIYRDLVADERRNHQLAGDVVAACKRVGALDQLRPEDGPLLVVATGPYVGEGFDCAALDTVFLAAPKTGVLASSLTKRAPGYASLGFPDPRRLQHLPPDRA
jgi:hypothetical protein